MKTLTMILLVGFTSFLYSSAQQGGEPKGESDCPCGCIADLTTEIFHLEKCGPECEVADTKTTTFTEIWDEPDANCASGLRRFSQETTTTTVKRETKQSSTYYVERFRNKGVHGTYDCSKCPPCPPLTETMECGKAPGMPCPPGPQDATSVPGPKKDEGCVGVKA